MERSVKGIYWTVILTGILIIATINFITLFPMEQGVTFDGADQDSFLAISESNDTGVVSDINLISNESNNAFDDWDVTTGFMGTNQIKQSQGSTGGLTSSSVGLVGRIKIIAEELFTSQDTDGNKEVSPIVWAIGVIGLALGVYMFYLGYQFIRSGN
jgi:hypothetical protein